MHNSQPEISIPLKNIEDGLALFIYEEQDKTLFLIEENEAAENGESPYQILEGRTYSYYFKNKNYQLKPHSGIVANSKRIDVSEGRITPNIYVGTLSLFVVKKDDAAFEYPVYVEVLATKLNSEPDKSYRENYRFMLESITKKCTELLLQINSPVNQQFEPDFERDNETIYQRFAFVQSLISSNEFNEAVQKIISSPTTKWTENLELKDIRNVRKFNGSVIRQLATRSNRVALKEDHYLATKYGIKDIPLKIVSHQKGETVDTPENRFIKYALESYLKFCVACETYFAARNYQRPQKEAMVIIGNLENHLNHAFFKEISRPNTLRLNSPVLQRKGGYREILNSWLMFDLAAKLIWSGGEKVYKAGKRDIAVLYEYWLFFCLYDLVRSKFSLNKHSHDDQPYDHLIVATNDGLNVMVKSGKHTALEGVYDSGKRRLCIKFSYNRTFAGGKKYTDKVTGSWTKSLRPDYTLSVWPADIDEIDAEKNELIVHIHFDSKYKVDQFTVEESVTTATDEEEDSLENEKLEERKGVYKNADLLKMHAYKDAIRRTGGAYILYPGTENQIPLRGFHEIIPGLGAFVMRPSEDNNGQEELSDFIDKVIGHFLDRASQRENISSKVYDVHKDEKLDDMMMHESLPEYINQIKLIPDDTYILVGFSKDEERFNWYEKHGKYNFRMDNKKGALILDNEVVNAKYLILRKSGSKTTSSIYKITSKGPEVYSKFKLAELGYPISEKAKDYYLVIDFEKINPSDFGNSTWRFKELAKYKRIILEEKNIRIASGIPFTVSLRELMNVEDKKFLK